MEKNARHIWWSSAGRADQHPHHTCMRIFELCFLCACVYAPSVTHVRYVLPQASANDRYLCIREFQVYGSSGELSLTASTCGSTPCAGGSSQWNDYEPARAVDGDSSTGFCADASWGWLEYRFAAPTIITRVVITFWSSSLSAGGTAYLTGSSDGSLFATLKTITSTGYTTLDESFADSPPSPPPLPPPSPPPPSPPGVSLEYIRFRVPPESANDQFLIVREFALHSGPDRLALTVATCGNEPCASGSTQYAKQVNDDWEPARAFDGDTTTAWSADDGYGTLTCACVGLDPGTTRGLCRPRLYMFVLSLC